jgi:hypothetical protein
MKKVIIGLGILVAFHFFQSTPCFGQISQDRIHVLLKLTPRPSEKSVRDREVFFDQQAILRVSSRAGEIPVTNAQIQCAFLYDEIQSTGKIKRKVFSDIVPCSLDSGREKSFDSKEFRLTGKITRDGRLIGMKFLGSCARIYEDGKLIYELNQPKEIEKDIAGLLAPLDTKPVMESSPAPVIPAPVIATGPKLEKTSRPIPESNATGLIDLFGFKFTTEEAEKALQSVNNLSEESLVSEIGLSKQAAHNIVIKRPFQKLLELPKVSYVKKHAIETLKLYVLKK